MDSRTGEIHQLAGRTLAELARDERGKPRDFVRIVRLPLGGCTECKGTGKLRRGLFSRRFKPCRCTLA